MNILEKILSYIVGPKIIGYQPIETPNAKRLPPPKNP